MKHGCGGVSNRLVLCPFKDYKTQRGRSERKREGERGREKERVDSLGLCWLGFRGWVFFRRGFLLRNHETEHLEGPREIKWGRETL